MIKVGDVIRPKGERTCFLVLRFDDFFGQRKSELSKFDTSDGYGKALVRVVKPKMKDGAVRWVITGKKEWGINFYPSWPLKLYYPRNRKKYNIAAESDPSHFTVVGEYFETLRRSSYLEEAEDQVIRAQKRLKTLQKIFEKAKNDPYVSEELLLELIKDQLL